MGRGGLAPDVRLFVRSQISGRQVENWVGFAIEASCSESLGGRPESE